MSIIRQKDGHPNVKFFESVETLNQFDTIRRALQKKEVKKGLGDDQQHFTKENIGQLVIQLLHFQEDQLGKQANGAAPVMRIPVRSGVPLVYHRFSRQRSLSLLQMECFLDFRETGALYTIVLGCYEYKNTNNW